MPVPWGNAGCQRRTKIKDTSDRAITIKQLDALRSWLQRLCKARLLKHTSDFALKSGKEGPINWYDIDLYNMTDEVIKKVIPYVDSEILDHDGERKRLSECRSQWCSWMEFVSSGVQKPKILISHWWGGRFRDFMHIVDMLAKEKCLSVNTGLWVCTFANCQWGEDFGVKIMDCPFVRAIKEAEYTLLIVDRSAGSLSRTWCGLELFYTVEQEKVLQVYTPAGQVGGSSGRASSGPLIEAIKEWDIRGTEASDDSYRRQIFNYIGHVSETKGLKTDKSGMEALTDEMGRPMLGDEEWDELRKRPNGKRERKYESKLFVEAGQRFEKLNMMIRLEVMASIGRAKKAHGRMIPDVAHRGITLGQWRALARKLELTCGTEWHPTDNPRQLTGAPRKWEDVDFYNVQKQYLDRHPLMMEQKCSYVELISDEPQIPEVYVNYFQGMKFKDIVSALDWFAEAKGLSDSTVLWINNIAYRLEPDEDFELNPRLPQDLDVSTTGRVLAECSSMVMLMTKEPDSMLRLWRLYEMELAGRCGLDIYLSCATGTLACNCDLAHGSWEFGVFSAEIGHMLSTIDLMNADSGNKDKEKILAWFQSQAHGGDGGIFERIHCRLIRWGAGPVLRQAAMEDDEATIVKVCNTKGVKVNSDGLKGSLGEGALHIAAAAGSTKALRTLLACKADPNLEDAMGETPLHYTALAGQAECARLLLRAGADPHSESSFVETPLEVAMQSPAGFLRVDTVEVQQVLEDACRARERMLPAVKSAFKDHLDRNNLTSTELVGALERLVPEIKPGELGQMLVAAGVEPGSDVNCEHFLEWLYR